MLTVLYVIFLVLFPFHCAFAVAGAFVYFREFKAESKARYIAFILVFPALYWFARYVAKGAKIIG